MVTNVIRTANVVKAPGGDERSHCAQTTGVTDPNENSTLAARIRLATALRGVDQRTFGTKAGLSHSFVGAFLLRAKKDPTASMSADNLRALADAWNLSLDWLQRGVGTPETNDGPRVVYDADDRYPNRTAALALLRDELHPETVRRVESMRLAAHTDPSRKTWTELILGEETRVRMLYGDEDPAQGSSKGPRP